MEDVAPERTLNFCWTPLIKHAKAIWGEMRANWPSLSKLFVYLISAPFRKFLLASELPTMIPGLERPAWFPLLRLHTHLTLGSRLLAQLSIDISEDWQDIRTWDQTGWACRTVPWYLSTYRRRYHHQHTIFVSRSHCEILLLGVGLRFHTLPSQGVCLVSYLPETEWST